MPVGDWVAMALPAGDRERAHELLAGEAVETLEDVTYLVSAVRRRSRAARVCGTRHMLTARGSHVVLMVRTLTALCYVVIRLATCDARPRPTAVGGGLHEHRHRCRGRGLALCGAAGGHGRGADGVRRLAWH
jgi:hypothetical protein